MMIILVIPKKTEEGESVAGEERTEVEEEREEEGRVLWTTARVPIVRRRDRRL